MKKLLGILIIFGIVLTASPALASFDKNLAYGSRGTTVREVQEFLTDQGVYTGPITGNYYSLTLKGVKAFQAREGIKASGYWNLATRTKANEVLATDLADSDQEQIDEPWVTVPSSPVASPTDVCANIEGVQTAVPLGLVSDNGNCVVSVSRPVVQQPVSSQPSGPQPYTEEELLKKIGTYYYNLPSLPVYYNVTKNSILFSCGKDFDVIFGGQQVLTNCRVDHPELPLENGSIAIRNWAEMTGLIPGTSYNYTLVFHEAGRPDSVFDKTIMTKYY